MGRMAYLFLFAILFYTGELSQAKSVNKSSNGPNITTRIGQVNNSNASSSSSSSTKVVLFRIGSQDTRQQRCRCVLFYQCENTDVVDVTSPEFLNESDIVCALGSEVCCREPVYLGGTTQQPSVTDIAITPITFNNTGLPPCVCVPSDQCAVGDPEALYSGAGKLDVRFTDCLSGEICCFPDELISTVGGGSSPTPLSPPTTPSTQEISTDVQPVTPPLVDIITPPVGAHTECGVRSLYRDSINTRIISPPGISDTEFGEFPWMAVIVRTDFEEGQRHDNVFHCGASFLSRSIIMTAAHCVYNMDRSRLKVRVGEYNTRFGVKREPMPHQDSSVSSIITHPDFNTKTMFNDIAIIVVETPFNLTPNVNPICMPSNDLPYDRNRCIATGWGQNSFDEGRFHDTLKKVELGLVPNDECQQRLRLTRLQKYFKLDPSFICAGGVQGADTCKGDGGGPLVCEIINQPNRYVQVGIVSWGIGCGDEVPAVYASIEANKVWLDRELAALTFNGVFRTRT